MRLIKSPEELGRRPLGVALFHAAIYGVAMLYFWVAVIAVGFGGWIVLRGWINQDHPSPADRRLLVGVGTASILLYSYVAIYRLSILADPDALLPAWAQLCFLLLFIGSFPILLICVPIMALLRAIAAALFWVIKRAGRDPDRWLDRVLSRVHRRGRC